MKKRDNISNQRGGVAQCVLRERERETKKFLLILFCVGVISLFFVGSVSAYTTKNSAFYCGNSTMNATEICDDCELALNDNTYYTVYLNESVLNVSGNCINQPDNFRNKILDCQGNSINGNGSGEEGIIFPLGNGANNTIQNCNISNFKIGIRSAYDITNTKIINNTFSSLSSMDIYFYGSGSSEIIIANNTINSSKDGIVFVSALGTLENVSVYGNSVTSSRYAIITSNSHNNNLYNNTLLAAGSGYLVFFSSSLNNTFSNNTITSSYGYGIVFWYSNSTLVFNNNITVTSGVPSVWIKYNSTDNNISTNNISATGSNTIYIENTNLNIISSNILSSSNSYDVIRIFDGASYNKISSNIITQLNSGLGIYIKNASNYNIIENNNFTTNSSYSVMIQQSAYANVTGNNVTTYSGYGNL